MFLSCKSLHIFAHSYTYIRVKNRVKIVPLFYPLALFAVLDDAIKQDSVNDIYLAIVAQVGGNAVDWYLI